MYSKNALEKSMRAWLSLIYKYFLLVAMLNLIFVVWEAEQGEVCCTFENIPISFVGVSCTM